MFVYFGLTGFIKTEITATRPLPEAVDKRDVERLYLNDNSDDRLKWDSFMHFITKDCYQFNQKFKPRHTNDVAIAENQFTQYVDGNLRIYVYSHSEYTRCCESKWSDWKKVFTLTSRNNFQVAKAALSGCRLHSPSQFNSDYLHACLLPYYYNNEGVLNALIAYTESYAPGKELMKKLRAACTNGEQQGMFAYKKDFYEEASDWDENHWSKRLAACLPELSFFDQKKYKIKYTATSGMKMFHQKQTISFFKFHGAPDLVIKDITKNTHIPVVSAGTEYQASSSSNVEEEESTSTLSQCTDHAVQSSGDSQETDVAIVENALVSTVKSKDSGSEVKDPTVLEKVGELLSNIHILFVKKALKRLKKQSMGIQTDLNLKLKGAVVSRGYGVATCTYEMPFLNAEHYKDDVIPHKDLASIQIQSEINVPLPTLLCALFQKLITS